MALPLPLTDYWPELIPELEAVLRSDGEDALAASVNQLFAYGVCQCGHCHSFHTSNVAGPWPVVGNHHNLAYLNEGIIFDVLDGAIVYVELLRHNPDPRWDVIAAHFATSPRPRPPQPDVAPA